MPELPEPPAPPCTPGAAPADLPPAVVSTPRRQLALQFAAAFLVLSIAWPYFGLRNEEMPWPASAFAIGACAFVFASASRQPWWWRLIHLAFAPLAWSVAQLDIDPGWFLLAFMALLLVYRGALTGQIPLYLSNTTTAAALADLTADRRGMRFLDLGAGVGSIVRPLAQARPDAWLTGVENAPATWLIGRLRTARLNNCDWRWGDLWKTGLADYDVVYAFLSPAPMSALWRKAEAEMRPGSLFVSNSFPVPGVVPSSIVELDDARQTQLFCYRR